MKKIAPLLIILAGALWGTMGLFVRHLNDVGLQSMEISALRNILAAALLFPGTAIRNRQLLKIRARNLWPLICSGIFSIVFFNFCYSGVSSKSDNFKLLRVISYNIQCLGSYGTCRTK